MNPTWKLSSTAVDPAVESSVDHAETVSDLFRDFQVALPSATLVRRDEPLAPRTTLRVGGPADIYVEPSSENALTSVIELCRMRNIPLFLLGRGSDRKSVV